MQDIREVLERWGVWCRDNREQVSWYRTTPGYGHMMKHSTSARASLCDDDGLHISRLVAEQTDGILVEYYVLEWPLRRIGQTRSRSVAWASKRLDLAEEQLASQLYEKQAGSPQNSAVSRRNAADYSILTQTIRPVDMCISLLTE